MLHYDEEGVGKAASPCKRAEAARIFYQVLVLKTHGFVEVDQADAYGEIDVSAGPKMKEKV